MKAKKWIALLLAFVLVLTLASCGKKADEPSTAAPTETSTEKATEAPTEAPTQAPTEPQTEAPASPARVGALKGPTSMGLVKFVEDLETAKDPAFTFTMAVQADELMAPLLKGDLDIALIPANAAATLYQKSKGAIQVININTLGVLYLVTDDDSVKTIEDLKGKTVCLTGKGTTPDYALQYLLNAYGLTTSDVTLEYKSEATEVAATLASQPGTIGLLPQPFVTSALMQNDKLHIAMDLTEEWDNAPTTKEGSRMLTGVTVVRKAFAEENPEAVAAFLKAHAESAAYTNEHPAEAAALIEKLGIVAKAAIAQKAIPFCKVTCITGEDVKPALSGYLEALYELNPASVGGALPNDDFYYTAK